MEINVYINSISYSTTVSSAIVEMSSSVDKRVGWFSELPWMADMDLCQLPRDLRGLLGLSRSISWLLLTNRLSPAVIREY